MKTSLENIQVIIFDFDGVLRSVSRLGLMEAYIAIIEAKGKDPKRFFTDLKTFMLWFDTDWHKNMEKIDGVYLEDSVTNTIFHRHYDPHVYLFPWVENLLPYLFVKYRFAILSSSSIHSVRQELGDVARFFDVIVDAETVKKLKPHPEGVRYILNDFGILPEEALIIGDTPQDFHAGHDAGIHTGLVKWGLADWRELRALKADRYFTHPSKLFLL